jgi:hypothetical protein
MVKVKVLEDFEIYGRRFYAGQIIEVALEVYELIKDKVEKLEEEHAEQV